MYKVNENDKSITLGCYKHQRGKVQRGGVVTYSKVTQSSDIMAWRKRHANCDKK